MIVKHLSAKVAKFQTFLLSVVIIVEAVKCSHRQLQASPLGRDNMKSGKSIVCQTICLSAVQLYLYSICTVVFVQYLYSCICLAAVQCTVGNR